MAINIHPGNPENVLKILALIKAPSISRGNGFPTQEAGRQWFFFLPHMPEIEGEKWKIQLLVESTAVHERIENSQRMRNHFAPNELCILISRLQPICTFYFCCLYERLHITITLIWTL